mmetsp:Transcript_13262/g.33706  ORF Transcript_13262/g.33706 Transcript_13262/m.33706 type:complete len:223 (-) Transcript_13262:733-1401(-)
MPTRTPLDGRSSSGSASSSESWKGRTSERSKGKFARESCRESTRSGEEADAELVPGSDCCTTVACVGVACWRTGGFPLPPLQPLPNSILGSGGAAPTTWPSRCCTFGPGGFSRLRSASCLRAARRPKCPRKALCRFVAAWFCILRSKIEAMLLNCSLPALLCPVLLHRAARAVAEDASTFTWTLAKIPAPYSRTSSRAWLTIAESSSRPPPRATRRQARALP